MANVQKEDGHTQIANSLIEAICRTRMPGRHNDVWWTIVRLSYGFNKRSDKIAYSQISSVSGIHKSDVSRCIADLRAWNMILVTDGPTKYSAKTIGIQKDFDHWAVPTQMGPKTAPAGDKSPSVGVNANKFTGVQPLVVSGQPLVSTPTDPLASTPITKDKRHITKDITQNVQKAPPGKNSKTLPPDHLTAEDEARVLDWAEVCLVIKKDNALGLIEECLAHHRAKGSKMSSWRDACQNWLRRAEQWARDAENLKLRDGERKWPGVPDYKTAKKRHAANLARERKNAEARESDSARRASTPPKKPIYQELAGGLRGIVGYEE